MTDPVPSADVLTHPAVARVRAALLALGVSSEVVVLDEDARTAAQAAQVLGVVPAQIANSLVFAVTPTPGGTPEPLLVITGGAHRVDTAKVAGLLELEGVDGVDGLALADARLVRQSTGFVIGGVAPVGHLRPVRTLVDVSLARHETVWAAAGHPRAVFSTTYDELLRLTGGQPIETA